MKIWTSSWFTELPPEIVRVGISRGVPRRQSGYRRLVELQPNDLAWAVRDDPDAFAARYREQLHRLDAAAIVAKLARLGEDNDVCLLCWEAPDPSAPWCHRALTAGWLNEQLGLRGRRIRVRGPAASEIAAAPAALITPAKPDDG